MADPVLDVESAMTPTQRRAAYARFVGANPGYRGAYWADILDDLLNHDAHLDVTEPMWDVHAGSFNPDIAPFYTPAILSLLYANGEPPSHEAAIDLASRAAKVSA